jgi:hypothetical protein
MDGGHEDGGDDHGGPEDGGPDHGGPEDGGADHGGPEDGGADHGGTEAGRPGGPGWPGWLDWLRQAPAAGLTGTAFPPAGGVRAGGADANAAGVRTGAAGRSASAGVGLVVTSRPADGAVVLSLRGPRVDTAPDGIVGSDGVAGVAAVVCSSRAGSVGRRRSASMPTSVAATVSASAGRWFASLANSCRISASSNAEARGAWLRNRAGVPSWCAAIHCIGVLALYADRPATNSCSRQPSE